MLSFLNNQAELDDIHSRLTMLSAAMKKFIIVPVLAQKDALLSLYAGSQIRTVEYAADRAPYHDLELTYKIGTVSLGIRMTYGLGTTVSQLAYHESRLSYGTEFDIDLSVLGTYKPAQKPSLKELVDSIRKDTADAYLNRVPLAIIAVTASGLMSKIELPFDLYCEIYRRDVLPLVRNPVVIDTTLAQKCNNLLPAIRSDMPRHASVIDSLLSLIKVGSTIYYNGSNKNAV